MHEKLAKWRGKSEREKHLIAIIGATVVTVGLGLVWATVFFSQLSTPKSVATETTTVKPPSPLASFGALVSETVGKLKSAVPVVLSNKEYISTSTGPIEN